MPLSQATLICIILPVLISIFLAWIPKTTIQKELLAVQAGSYPLLKGYQKVADVIAGARYLTIIVNVIFVGVWFYQNIETLVAYFSVLIGLVFCIVGAIFILPLLVFEVCKIFFVDIPGRVAFQLPPISPRQVILYRLRGLLLGRGLQFLLIEVTGVAGLQGNVLSLWLFPLLVVVYTLASVFFSKQIFLWCNYTVPVEQSEWVYLAPRIKAWSRRVGATFQEVRVLYTTQIGMTRSAQLVNPGSPVLLLNDLFLKQTDWRQQDAMLVHSLFLNHFQIIRSFMVLIIARMAFVCITFTLLLASFVSLSFFADVNTWFVVFMLIVAFILLLCIGFIVFVRIYQGRLRTRYMQADSLAEELTGDPLAMIVTLHMVHVLNSLQKPEAQIRKLEETLRQSRPLAPWAGLPVPSAIPYTRFGVLLTVPLSSATESAPVPVEPYPVSVFQFSNVGGQRSPSPSSPSTLSEFFSQW